MLILCFQIFLLNYSSFRKLIAERNTKISAIFMTSLLSCDVITPYDIIAKLTFTPPTARAYEVRPAGP